MSDPRIQILNHGGHGEHRGELEIREKFPCALGALCG
jgi:hypothetical protein